MACALLGYYIPSSGASAYAHRCSSATFPGAASCGPNFGEWLCVPPWFYLRDICGQFGLYMIIVVLLLDLVTTIAGSGSATWTDGVGAAAHFNNPSGVFVDSNGVIFVADSYNNRIRCIGTSGSSLRAFCGGCADCSYCCFCL